MPQEGKTAGEKRNTPGQAPEPGPGLYGRGGGMLSAGT